MKQVLRGDPIRTYTLPPTATVIGRRAFEYSNVRYVRFNDGLQRLESMCFGYSKIRRLTLPVSVCVVEDYAFFDCRCLRRADLKAARGLVSLEEYAFCQCDKLGCVLLGEGLQTIRPKCFQ